MTKKKTIAIATLGGIALFALGMTSGIWLATPDSISGAPQDETGRVPKWAWDLCECTKNGITYLMPDVWSRGPEVDDTQDGEVLVAQALETQAQAGMILDIDTGQPHASVKAVVVSSTDVQDVQTVEATADESGRAKIQFERDVDTGYVITLTVNGQAYTMTDKESTCDRLEIVAARSFTTPEGVQCMTLDVVLKDVPETPPTPPTPDTPDEPDIPIKGAFTTPKVSEAPEDDEKPEKDEDRVTAPMQKPTPSQNDTPTPISQGMPTGIIPANPVAWFIQWLTGLWV